MCTIVYHAVESGCVAAIFCLRNTDLEVHDVEGTVVVTVGLNLRR
jgi:hypothetical protein